MAYQMLANCMDQPATPVKEGWVMHVFHGVNISWTVTGRKTGTSKVIRAERLNAEMVAAFDPDVFFAAGLR